MIPSSVIVLSWTSSEIYICLNLKFFHNLIHIEMAQTSKIFLHWRWRSVLITWSERYHHKKLSALLYVMDWCRQASIHYMNQCLHIMSKVLWNFHIHYHSDIYQANFLHLLMGWLHGTHTIGTIVVVIVRRAGLLWSQRDFEWRWSVPLFKCLTVLEFSFILFDLCLLITFFNFIMNYVPIVTFWIFTYHKIWILSIMFCSIWSYWIIYFLACLEVSWRVVS